MKNFFFILLLIIISIFLTSCSSRKSRIDFKLGEDGLIYNHDNEGLYTGTIIDTSNVIIEFQVVNGKKNGTFRTYYLNGQIEKYGYIVNNNNIGEWKYYYPNGQLESSGNFENNMPEGEWTLYYQNGNIRCEGNYRKGKQQDRWIYYNEEGEIINIIFYQDGAFSDLQQKYS